MRWNGEASDSWSIVRYFHGRSGSTWSCIGAAVLNDAFEQGASLQPVLAMGLSRDDLFLLFMEIRPELLELLQRRTGQADVAADLAQDVFVRLSSIRAVLSDRQQARAYIFRMAMNVVIDRSRNEARRNRILSGVELLFEDAAPDPEAMTVNRDQIRRIDRALEELPPKCREVLMLARVYGLSHKEIADRMGVSVSLVEKYQLRAMRHCQSRLADRGPS